MSNIFKNNSHNRFQFLDDSEPIKDKCKSNDKNNRVDKNNKHLNEKDNNSLRKNNFNMDIKKDNKDNDKINCFRYIKNINEQKTNNEIIIVKEEFPELSSVRQHNLDAPIKVYKNLFDIKEETDKENNYIQEEIIPDGCICISYNKINRKIEYKQGKIDRIKKINVQEVMDNIARFYNKRKNDYINSWGLDTYEDTFLFKNYDYDYFNKLDIKYEIEMEHLDKEINLEEQFENIDDYY